MPATGQQLQNACIAGTADGCACRWARRHCSAVDVKVANYCGLQSHGRVVDHRSLAALSPALPRPLLGGWVPGRGLCGPQEPPNPRSCRLDRPSIANELPAAARPNARSRRAAAGGAGGPSIDCREWSQRLEGSVGAAAGAALPPPPVAAPAACRLCCRAGQRRNTQAPPLPAAGECNSQTCGS